MCNHANTYIKSSQLPFMSGEHFIWVMTEWCINCGLKLGTKERIFYEYKNEERKKETN